MTYRITEQEAQTISKALGSLEAVANQMQARLNTRVSMLCRIAIYDPVAFGVLLSLSRNVDTLERVCSDLAGMINRPPAEPLEDQREPEAA